MIESSVHLITDIKGSAPRERRLTEENISAGTSQAADDEMMKKKGFLLHVSTCSQRIFLHLSWIHKFHFLSQLVENIRSLTTFNLVLNTTFAASDKVSCYSKTVVETNFVFDKVPQDHDRLLGPDQIKQFLDDEVKWFDTLSNNEQVTVLIVLLRIAGGAIVREIYRVLHKCYLDRLDASPKPKAETTTAVHDGDCSVFAMDDTIDKNLPNLREVRQHDPTDPMHIACENETKRWKITINKYKKQVEAAERKLNLKKTSAKVEGKSKKSKKGSTSAESTSKSKGTKKTKKGSASSGSSSKSDKRGKKKGSGKSSKGSSKKSGKSKKKSGDKSEVDWIQQLPIWIVKKIFGYLDSKSLKKCKTVNEYWKWAINDFLADVKMRKALDKSLKLLEKSTDERYGPFELENFEEPPERISITEKRIKRGNDRGAILEKLGHTDKPLVEISLLVKALTEMAECYILPVIDLLTFPRVIQPPEALYSFPEVVAVDLGLYLNVEIEQNEEEDDKQNSNWSSTTTISKTSNQP